MTGEYAEVKDLFRNIVLKTWQIFDKLCLLGICQRLRLLENRCNEFQKLLIEWFCVQISSKPDLNKVLNQVGNWKLQRMSSAHKITTPSNHMQNNCFIQLRNKHRFGFVFKLKFYNKLSTQLKLFFQFFFVFFLFLSLILSLLSLSLSLSISLSHLQEKNFCASSNVLFPHEKKIARKYNFEKFFSRYCQFRSALITCILYFFLWIVFGNFLFSRVILFHK